MNRRIALLAAWLATAACGVSDDPVPDREEEEDIRLEPRVSLESGVAELRLAWPLPHLLEGEHRYLAVEVLDERGNVIEDVPTTWTSSDSDVLVVDARGKVTGLSSGRAEVRATVEGLTETWTVEVRSADPARIQLSASWLSIDWGTVARVHARVYNDTGVVLPVTVQWWSDDPDVASVDDAGRITGVTPGSTTIHAAAGAASESVHVEVVDRTD